MTDETQTDDAQIRVKANLLHDKRNQQADVSAIEERVMQMVNHPEQRIDYLRIAVGEAAGAVFFHLVPRRWDSDDMERIAKDVAHWMESEHYASDIRVTQTYIEAQ